MFDDDAVARGHRSLGDHLQVRAAIAASDEPGGPVALLRTDREGAARGTGAGHLEEQTVVADAPPLADDGVGGGEPGDVQILAEPADGQFPVEFGAPAARLVLREGVDGLVDAAVVGGVALAVAGQAELADVHRPVDGTLVDRGDGITPQSGLVQRVHDADRCDGPRRRPRAGRLGGHRPRNRSTAALPAWMPSSGGMESGSMDAAHGPATRAVSGVMVRLTSASAIGPSS